MRGRAKSGRRSSTCIQCRRRKIKCDGNVPNCGNCVHRGITRSCRWGDERDIALPNRSASDPSFSGPDPSVWASAPDIIYPIDEWYIKGSQGAGPQRSDAEYLGESTFNPTRPKLVANEGENESRVVSIPPLNTASECSRLPHLYYSNHRLWYNEMIEHIRDLPEVPIFEKMIGFYLRELEPLNNFFNRVVLMEDTNELWRHLTKVQCSMRRKSKGQDKKGDLAHSIVGSLDLGRQQGTLATDGAELNEANGFDARA